MRFAGKVALVTGAASGIGRETALGFAREGAALVLADLNEVGGRETQQMAAALGAQVLFQAIDVTQGAQVADLVRAALDQCGALHCAVNSAGISGGTLRSIVETDEADFDRVIAINLKGVWLSMKHEIPAMLASGGGAIVNLASVAGLLGFAGGAGYSASKHGVIGLTRSVALEMARRGLRVNALCPSFIDTPMVSQIAEVHPQMDERTRSASPMKRLGTPAEVATAALWLCSDEASFVNGTTLAVDGGLTAM